MLAGLEFHQLERARADHVFVVARVALWVLAVAIDMFGDDRHQLSGHRQHQRRVRLGQVQHGRVVVRRIHRCHRREHGLEGVVFLDHVDRESHVFGSDRLAVMEGGVS